MVSRRVVTALVLAQLLALGLAAQEMAAQPSSEFGRASGGDLVLTPKGSAPLSGSLDLSLSRGGDVFGRDAKAYGITAGGTLLQDRLWFFASGSRQEATPSHFADLGFPQNATAGAIRTNAQLSASQSFSTFFEAARRPQASAASPIGVSPFAASGPSSFLSLHYTGIVSNSMFFSGSVTRSSTTRSNLGLFPAE
jgi:hypothetical protein